MNPPSPFNPQNAAIEEVAANWILRRDRGFTAAEQDEFLQWQAADARHRDALLLQQWSWEELDRLAGLHHVALGAPDPDLLAPTARPPHRWLMPRARWLALSALAALVVFGGWLGWPSATGPEIVVAQIERRTLPDGSVVELNRGAEISVDFDMYRRHVQLVRGEANFVVAHDTEHPFIVDADGIKVRAVGTAFNVKLGAEAVEVVVTEGKVQVATARVYDAHGQIASVDSGVGVVVPLLHASQRVVVARSEKTRQRAEPSVEDLSGAEIDEALRWQPRLLEFSDASMGTIVAEFNQHNPVSIVIGDTKVGAMRLTASFRSDNVEGFVRLMESTFNLKAEWDGTTRIVLRSR